MGFSTTWLDLREPLDHSARDKGLLDRAARCVGRGEHILDLGSGTGSTARAFSRRVPAAAWRFLDADEALLSVAGARHPKAERVRADLGDIETLPLDGVGLVTASALLDLMPAEWIAKLAAQLKALDLPFYAALTYNGQMNWTPALPDDHTVVDAFNRHQKTDKGLGPATGPDAVAQAKEAFEAAGFKVMTAETPSTIEGSHGAFQQELLGGIAGAAEEMGYRGAGDWLAARRAAIPTTVGQIGHSDMLAVLP